ncbi:MAG: hypothetical protein ABIG63_11515 [Chloroflexota bacterium]
MSKQIFSLSTPLLNAAGILGFAPDARSPVDMARLGAFVTNPVSRAARTPARGERYIPYPGGFLLHTGLPNPGLNAVIRLYKTRWARSPLPVIVHLLAQEAASLRKMVEQLEDVEGVMGVEIGLPPDGDADLAYGLAAAAVGELPVIVRVPFKCCAEIAEAVAETGVSAVSLAAPRGTLTGQDGNLVSGRLYGPAVFALALGAVRKLAGLGIPLIGAGGVYRQADVDAMLAAGAMAVQLDAVLWRGGF